MGGQIIQGGTFVAHEECFSVYRYLGNALTLDGHRTVLTHFDARHLFQQVLEHIALGDGKGRRIVNQGITTYLHRIQGSRHLCGFEHSHVFLEKYRANVGIIRQVQGFHIRLIAQYLHIQCILAAGHIADYSLAFLVGKGEIGDDGIFCRF